MIYPAGLYVGEKKYVALYNYQCDVYVKPPEDFRARYVAHFSYEYGRRKGGVDVFQLNEGESPERIAKLVTYVTPKSDGFYIKKDNCEKKEEKYFPKSRLTNAGAMHNINAQIVLNLPENERQEIINFTFTDILEFCRGIEARQKREPILEFPERIIPKTKIKYITPERILTRGKQEFVPSCLLEANIDFGQGCINSFIPGESIFESEKAKFDGEIFTNYFTSPWGECGYCYADRHHRCFPKTLYLFDKEKLEEELKGGFVINPDTGETLKRPVKTLRFGKRTESYSPFTRDNFLQTLESCINVGTRAVIPTKMMPYDNEIAQLVKRSNSSLLFSIGADMDKFEIGACSQGFDNKTRIANAVKYHEKKVNALIYLNVANPLEISKEQWDIIKSAQEKGIKVQVLPIRYKRKRIMEAMSGLDWDIVKNIQTDLFNQDAGTYYHEGNQLIPKINRMDPKLISIIGSNKGQVCMCHHDDKKAYCGGCGIAEGKICDRVEFIKRRFPGR